MCVFLRTIRNEEIIIPVRRRQTVGVRPTRDGNMHVFEKSESSEFPDYLSF